MTVAAYIGKATLALLPAAARKRSVHRLIEDADNARSRKDWHQAARGYAAAFAADRSRAGLKVQLAHSLKEMGDYESAERLYRGYLRDHPEDADIHLQLGHLFNRQGEFETALAFYEKAHALAPDNVDISFHAQKARQYAGRADVAHRREAALALLALGNWEAARRELQSLVAIDREKDLIGVLANATKETGRLDEATALYDCYLSYGAASQRLDLIADGHLQLGHLHKIKGDHQVALKHFLEARKVERQIGTKDEDDAHLDGEIFASLRKIYPCFLFQG